MSVVVPTFDQSAIVRASNAEVLGGFNVVRTLQLAKFSGMGKTSRRRIGGMLVLEVVTVSLVAVAMALSLAHALEFPGKMRLPKEAYLATQTIYYPGFTVGGFGEGLGLIATFVFMLVIPHTSPAFLSAVVAFTSLITMHVVFWTVTQPVNRHWVAALPLTNTARSFFSVHQNTPQSAIGDEWKQLRNRWEYSHIVRAVFASISLVSLTIAVALYGAR